MATVNIVFFKPNYLSNVSTVISGSGVLAAQNITSSATSQQSAATTEKSVVRISTSGDIYIKTGINPTAASADEILIPAGSTEYIGLPEGYKVAVIDA